MVTILKSMARDLLLHLQIAIYNHSQTMPGHLKQENKKGKT